MANTVDVTGTIKDQFDLPIPNAKCTVELDRTDVDQGYVSPVYTTAITDDAGQFTMALWPNQRGARSSKYKFTAQHPTTGKILVKTTFVVPFENSTGDPVDTVNIFEIAELEAYEGKSDAEVALEVLQAEAGAAHTARAVAETKAAEALASATNAAASETAAGNYQLGMQSYVDQTAANAAEAAAAITTVQTVATNAATSETNAAASETAAAASETAAATSKTAAAASETAAATSKTDALAAELKAKKWADNNEDIAVETGLYSAKHHASKAAASGTYANTQATASAASATAASAQATAATASATTAATKATESSTSALAAAASATSAATDASTALTKSNAAGTSAANAAASATSASNSAISASSSETNAAGSASSASTSATNASTSETNAFNSASSASNSATAASTSATQSANSATASATSATNAATSKTNAETSAANSANSATASASSATASAASAADAGNSATNAANLASDASTSATNAASSAINAADAEGDAATSAATATTQAGIATTQAGIAITQATNAASSATSAQASLDEFQGQYHGASATAPTVNIDTGDLYFDTAIDEMMVYTGTEWKKAGSTVNGTSKRQTYTATAGQTAFSVTGGYDSGFADVYLNGVKLVNGVDVDVSSGTGFTLTTGATVGDNVDFIGYGAFEVADTYTQAEINNTYGSEGRTQSSTDTTAGRLLKVGDFGVGKSNTQEVVDLNTLTKTGFYSVGSAATNKPAAHSGLVFVETGHNSILAKQTFTENASGVSVPKVFVRQKNYNTDTWNDWQEIYHTGNTGTAVTSDVTTSSTDTTAGRLLKVGDFGVGTGVRNWQAVVSSATNNLYWWKLCEIDSTEHSERHALHLSGARGYGAGQDISSNGATIYLTSANQGSPDNLNASVYNASSTFRLIHGCVVTYDGWKGTVWVQLADFAGVNVLSQSNSIVNQYTNIGQLAKPVGAYDKDVYDNYSTSNAVGTVSQSAGVPTGAIIERGSNSNGEYVKFADGTMICMKEAATDTITSQSVGAIYSAPMAGFTFPVSFIATPRVSPAGRYVTGSSIASAFIRSVGYGSVSMHAYSHASNGSVRLGYIAIGRWY